MEFSKKKKNRFSFVVDYLEYRVLSGDVNEVEVMAPNASCMRDSYQREHNANEVINLQGVIHIPSNVKYKGVSYQVVAIADRGFEKQSVILERSIHKEYPSGIQKVYIPPTIVRIGKRAFYKCFSMSEIIIPSSVEIIDDEAFKSCWEVFDFDYECYDTCGLQKVTFEKNKNDESINGFIGKYAFAGCNKLEEIQIPGRFKSIGDYAFECCNSIDENNCGPKKVFMHNGIKSIGKDIFRGCTSLRSLILPHTVTDIDDNLMSLMSSCPQSDGSSEDITLSRL